MTGPATVRVFHRTNDAGAATIWASGMFLSRENTGEIFVSNREHGEATGYGKRVVVLDVPEHILRLDDEFPDGEKHYAVRAVLIEPRFIVGYDTTA